MNSTLEKILKGTKKAGSKIGQGISSTTSAGKEKWNSLSKEGKTYTLLIGTVGVFGASVAYTILSSESRNNLENQPEYATGYVFDQRNEEIIEQELERVVLHGEEFYVQKINNEENQIGLKFIPFEKSKRIHDLDTGNEKIISEENYIPLKVSVENYTKNQWADEVTLKINYDSETNVPGVKAKMSSKNDLRVEAGDNLNGIGFSGKDKVNYNIDRAEIFGETYFLPHIERSKIGQKEGLNFYIIPEKGTQIIIDNKNGQISLRNEDNIYRPYTDSLLNLQKETTFVEEIKAN